MSLYDLMCKDSPVQKDWKPEYGQIIYNPNGEVTDDIAGYLDNSTPTDLKKKEVTWLPSQEDWQEIYHNSEENYPLPINLRTTLNREIYHMKVAGVFEGKWWNILWCLFVHKEVYGLTWDWEEDRWVKE